MISAVSAPIVTRTRFATGTTDPTSPPMWFRAESSAEASATVTSQGWTTTDAPGGRVARADDAAAVELDDREPGGAAAGAGGSRR